MLIRIAPGSVQLTCAAVYLIDIAWVSYMQAAAAAKLLPMDKQAQQLSIKIYAKLSQNVNEVIKTFDPPHVPFILS